MMPPEKMQQIGGNYILDVGREPPYLAATWPRGRTVPRWATLGNADGDAFRRAWGDADMLRINKDLLDCVFYLYPSEEAAVRGVGLGGTGFFVSTPSQRVASARFVFAVTNKHVAANNNFIRLNKVGGGIAVVEVFDWHINAQHDLAIAMAVIDRKQFVAKWIPQGMFAGPQDDLVQGDHVFMIGRFIHIDGKQSNTPSVRFGNLSMLETVVSHPQYGSQQSFVVEMRSMCGYSGSPCFLMPAALDLRTGNTNLSGKVLFLGTHWGHVTEHLSVEEKIARVDVSTAGQERRVQYVNANTGMNGVVAAWHISSLIEDFRPAMMRDEDNLLRQVGATSSGTATDG